MKYQEWQKRRMSRPDLSQYLVHLTRQSTELEHFEVLFKILKEKRITASTTSSGFICGNIPAVCFQDAPIQSIGFNVWHEQEINKKEEKSKIRYQACGLMFRKQYIFRKGGRPVIYEKTETAKSFLPRNEWWRIVKLDMDDSDNIVDWTHEREWRLPNNLCFELEQATVILPNPFYQKKFIELCKKDCPEILNEISGIINLSFVF